MNNLKRIFYIFLAILFLLSINVFADFDYSQYTPEELKIIDDPLYEKSIQPQTIAVGTAGREETLDSVASKFENESSVIGIDVSEYNEDIDWKVVKDSGVKFAIIRCAYRGVLTGILYEDECFKKNIEGALNNGIYVGVYYA